MGLVVCQDRLWKRYDTAEKRGIDMGTFQYTIEVGDAQQQRFRGVEAWVDSGATYSSLPGDLLAANHPTKAWNKVRCGVQLGPLSAVSW